MAAEAAFLERVIELHPDADGKPVVIGNCQGGWAMMMVAATRPELFGPIIVAGAPLSYWAGVRGQNPMRYSGGLYGGSWLTALAGDLGHGIFDGAALVENFENMNPANTLWTKQYNLYAKVDTEAPRYLGFEKWWGGHVLLNAEEMQWIVDNLFVGNKLATAEIVTGDGVRIDLRNITLADHLLLLQGRQHHPAAAGAGLDPGPLRERRRHPGQRPDHRLLRARHDRPSRHLRLRQRGEEGARGVRHQHRLHRLPAARAVRGGADARSTRRSRERPRGRRLSGAVRGAHARRYPSAGRQRASRTSASSRRWPGCPRSISASTARSCSLGPGGHHRAGGRAAAPAEPVAAAVRAVLRPQPADGAGRGRGRAGARQSPAGRRRQSVPGRAEAAVRARSWRHSTAGATGATPRSRPASMHSTARLWSRRCSACGQRCAAAAATGAGAGGDRLRPEPDRRPQGAHRAGRHARGVHPRRSSMSACPSSPPTSAASPCSTRSARSTRPI